MTASTGSLVRQVALVAAGIGAYHFAFAPKGATPGTHRFDAPGATTDESIAALRRDLDSMKKRAGGNPAEAGASAGAIAALLSRLEALEGRVIPSSADAGARDLGRPPPGVGEPPTTWTEDQLASLRAMMDEVESRKLRDRETSAFRDLIRRIAPTIAPSDESAAASLVTEFMRKIRGLFKGGSAGGTPEERAATTKAAADERTKLLRDLGTLLSKDALEQLSGHIPDFSVPMGHTPPAVNEPGMDAPK